MAAVLLAAVLSWAGIAKLRRPRGTAASFAALGLPFARLLARAVPVAELVVAALLVVRPRMGAATALVLLAGFTVVLARGGDVGCACFGRVAARPVSAATFARNAGLALLAVAALVPARPTSPALPEVVLTTTAVALGTVVLAALDLRSGVGGSS